MWASIEKELSGKEKIALSRFKFGANDLEKGIGHLLEQNCTFQNKWGTYQRW